MMVFCSRASAFSEIIMQAIELETIIDNRHEIHLQLPPQARQGKARVIVLYEEAEPSVEPGNLDDFLNRLPRNADGIKFEDIVKRLQEERDSWGDDA
jgi:hypothetical protein